MAQKKKSDGEEFAVIGKGFVSMFKRPQRLAVMAAVVILCYLIARNREFVAAKFDFPNPVMVYVVWAVPILVLAIFGVMKGSETYKEMFESIHFTNPNGETPRLVKKSKDETGKKEILEFQSQGIEMRKWRQSKDQLESALNLTILRIRQAKDSKQKIILETVPASVIIPDRIDWDDSFISDKDFVLTLGRGLLDDVTVNLNKEPHALIAGVTGSGKSVVLRTMFWQSIRKGAKCFAIDFKGGVEFSGPFEEMAEIVHEVDDAIELFTRLVREMKMRLEVFKQTGCKNIKSYNQMFPDDPLCRVVLVCDEVAELLDKDGLTKEEKEPLQTIEKHMSSLARLSRAAGINMMLATQRPDASVIKGQVKNNLPIRISGRMVDEGVSKMVLGNDKATYLDNTIGRFLYTVGSDMFEFQGYMFEDDMMTIGDYVKGRMLTDGISEKAKEKLDTIEDDSLTQFDIPKEESAEWINPDDVSFD